jgi:hypothetical protein
VRAPRQTLEHGCCIKKWVRAESVAQAGSCLSIRSPIGREEDVAVEPPTVHMRDDNLVLTVAQIVLDVVWKRTTSGVTDPVRGPLRSALPSEG